MRELKVLSLFSGIGAFEKALENMDIPFDLLGYCEIDKYASKSYAAVHGVSEDLNLWDVTKLDTSKIPMDIDLLTGGFPCQDISVAGKGKGAFDEDGNKTRSGLAYDMLRIIGEVMPKVIITENVKNLVSKKHEVFFHDILGELERYGYDNHSKVMNAKDYGIHQNRERVFIVSIRRDLAYNPFVFPAIKLLTTCLGDFLEDVVEEKYYLSQEMTDRFVASGGMDKLKEKLDEAE